MAWDLDLRANPSDGNLALLEVGADGPIIVTSEPVVAVSDEAFAEPPDTTIYVWGVTAEASEDEAVAADQVVRVHTEAPAAEDETLAVQASSTDTGATVVFSEAVVASVDEAASASHAVRIRSTAAAHADEAFTATQRVRVHSTAAADTDETASAAWSVVVFVEAAAVEDESVAVDGGYAVELTVDPDNLYISAGRGRLWVP